ncbi:MAG: hypothetical protein HYY02_06665 [Chloroflexi bacterium]|nr:hypothetical protein [Chloroflexota bacterium]
MNPSERQRLSALLRWQRAAGPFWPYVDATPFLWPVPLPVEPPRPLRAPRSVLDALSALPPGGPACRTGRLGVVFVDLPTIPALRGALALNRAGLYVVPLISRWPAAPAALACGRLQAQLLAAARLLRRPVAPRGVVFLLDGDRAGRRGPGAPPHAVRAFDNRYSYSANELPSAEALMALGCGSAIWLTPGAVAPDLRRYVDELARGGIALELRSMAPQRA